MSQHKPDPEAVALYRLIDAADVLHAQALGGRVKAAAAREYAISRRNYQQITRALRPEGERIPAVIRVRPSSAGTPQGEAHGLPAGAPEWARAQAPTRGMRDRLAADLRKRYPQARVVVHALDDEPEDRGPE